MTNYKQLDDDILALQELIDWCSIDSQKNSFSIVDPSWTIYRTLHQVYNTPALALYLNHNGILITPDDEEDGHIIYQIQYI